jgi:hypothetical protein
MSRKRKEAEARGKEAEEVSGTLGDAQEKRKKRKKHTKEGNKKELTPCLPDYPNLLNIILDYALHAQAGEVSPLFPTLTHDVPVTAWTDETVTQARHGGLDHPLRGVNRATRQAWLAHPISLPFRLRLHLAPSSPAARLPLAQRVRTRTLTRAQHTTHAHGMRANDHDRTVFVVVSVGAGGHARERGVQLRVRGEGGEEREAKGHDLRRGP